MDSNQDYLHPGHMLTSMVKHVDVATYKGFMEAKSGTFKPGLQVLGLKDNGVGIAFDQWNESLIKPEWKAKVAEATKGIIDGTIKVHNFSDDNKCPE